MTAEEIRRMNMALIDKGGESLELDTEFHIAFFLREIAAQLAELNEHLKKVDEAVFTK